MVERKFIHECGSVGHVEDIVTDGAVRGKGLGRAIVGAVVDAAKQQGCYKVILDLSLIHI